MPPLHRLPHGQRGLSLIELMVSIAIGLFLLLGVTTLIVQQNSTRDELEKSSRQIENGRYAIQTLRDDIQLAGYYGELYMGVPAINPANPLPNPCETNPLNLPTGLPFYVQGYDAAANAAPVAASPIPCLSNLNLKAGSDILVIRRTATGVETGQINALPTPEILMQTNGDNFAFGTVNAGFNTANVPYPAPFVLAVSGVAPPNPPAIPPARLREYWVRIYFVAPCSVPADGTSVCTCVQQPPPDSRCLGRDDGGIPIPTLKRLDITAENRTTPPVPIPIAEGIEAMQLDYGVDTNGDGYPDQFQADPTVATAPNNPGGLIQWGNTMAVRINLLARNTSCTTGFQDPKTYNAGPVTGIIPLPTPACPNGDFKRHMFIEQVRIVNPSARRAQQ